MINLLLHFLGLLMQLARVQPTPPPAQDGEEINDDDPATETQPVEPKPMPSPARSRQPRYHWILDNGHGIETEGKRSPEFPDGSITQEAVVMRQIVQRISDKLNVLGIWHTVLVPEPHDVPLQARVDKAHAIKTTLPKFFLSLHSNASRGEGWQEPRGLEIWHEYHSKAGKALAKIFLLHILEATGWKSRGLKSRIVKQFFVLIRTKMPAILTENGFHNNIKDAAQLKDPAFQDKLAEAYVKAILYVEAKGI